MRDGKGSYPCLENLFGKKSQFIHTTIDYDEVKQKAKENVLVKIDDKLFNPQYVKNIIDCFDDYNVSVRSDFPLMLIEGDGITAIICGIREVK